MRYFVKAHIPHDSGDAEYHIVDAHSNAVVAIVDPHSDHTDGAELAEEIAAAMNTCQVMGG